MCSNSYMMNLISEVHWFWHLRFIRCDFNKWQYLSFTTVVLFCFWCLLLNSYSVFCWHSHFNSQCETLFPESSYTNWCLTLSLRMSDWFRRMSLWLIECFMMNCDHVVNVWSMSSLTHCVSRKTLNTSKILWILLKKCCSFRSLTFSACELF